MQLGQAVCWSTCHGWLGLLACVLPHDSLLAHSFHGDCSENVRTPRRQNDLSPQGRSPAGTPGYT
jgi:hypothetical protein